LGKHKDDYARAPGAEGAGGGKEGKGRKESVVVAAFFLFLAETASNDSMLQNAN